MTTKEKRMQTKLAFVVGASALASLAYSFRDALKRFFVGTASAATPAGDPIAAPAYPYLVSKWSQDDRLALLNANKELGLDPLVGAIAGVIQHESGGDPTAPHEASGTPRGGLIQLTQGANLPGFKTADDVWAVRDLSIPDQFRLVVVPCYARMHLPSDISLVMLMRKNFLPGVAGKDASFVLGVKDGATGPGGETSETKLIEGQSLTLGQIFRANPGFARGKDWFTWADADASAASTEAKAGGQFVTVSGEVRR